MWVSVIKCNRWLAYHPWGNYGLEKTMIEQALKLAADFDEQAGFMYEMALKSDADSPVAQQLNHYHVKFAKEHEANAQLVRDMVAEIQRLRGEK